MVKQELDTAAKDLRSSMAFNPKTDDRLPAAVKFYNTSALQTGLNSQSKILEELELMQKTYDHDLVKRKCGNLQVYYNDTNLLEMQSAVYKRFNKTNMLHADHFQAARKIEAEVVRQVITLYNGNASC